jgi:hypothetical protein
VNTVRRRAAVGSLLGAPLLLLAAHLLQPAHGTTTSAEVAAQAADPGAFNASTAVGLLAMLLLVPAVTTLAGLLPDRWSGHVGGGLALTGAVGLTFLLGTGVGATTIGAHGGAAAVALTDRLESNPAYGLGVGLMLVGWTFGLLVLAVGLWRAGRVPAWGALALGVGPLVPAFAGGRAGVAVGFLVLLAGFATAARAVVTEPEREPVPA